MEEKPFSLKCDARSVKVSFDNSENISIIKVFPDCKSDIRIVFGNHHVTISDEKRKKDFVKN